MHKSELSQLIHTYKANRGWWRWLFGDTTGMKELIRFHRQLDNADLSMDSLQTLFSILTSRRDRLVGRRDDYPTALGKKKLTNTIYVELERQLVEAYRVQMLKQGGITQASIDQFLPRNTPITELIVMRSTSSLGEIKNNVRWYAFNIQAALQNVSLRSGISNPYTGNPLSNANLERLKQNSVLSRLITLVESVIQRFKSTAAQPFQSQYQDVPVFELAFDRDGNPISLEDELKRSSYGNFSKTKEYFDSAVKKHAFLRNSKLWKNFESIQNRYEKIKSIGQLNPGRIQFSTKNETPLLYWFLSEDASCELDIRKVLIDPEAHAKLSLKNWNEIVAFVNNNPEIAQHEKEVFTKKANQIRENWIKEAILRVSYANFKEMTDSVSAVTWQGADLQYLRQGYEAAQAMVKNKKSEPHLAKMNTIPLAYLFISNDCRLCFDLRTVLADKNAQGALSAKKWQEIIRHLTNNPFISAEEKAAFMADVDNLPTTPPNKTLLLGIAEEEIVDGNRFTTESGHTFDAVLLLQTFTTKGFLNPSTQIALSENDLETLRSHPVVGDTFKHLEQVLMQYNHLKAKTNAASASHDLLHLFVSAKGEVIDIYRQKDFILHVTQRYLENQLSREEFRAVLNQAYNQSAKDIAIKQQLNAEQEQELEDDSIFENLKTAITFQTNFGFETLPNGIFWQLMEKELKLVLGVEKIPTSRMSKLNGALSTIYAIWDFDLKAKDYLAKAGYGGTINYPLGWYNDQFGEHQYVVRMEETKGDIKGKKTLENIVNTFKGGLLTALRHDVCKPMIDKLDTSGICIGERMRMLNAWRVGLDRPFEDKPSKTVMDLMSEYQEELTRSSGSRSMLIDGNNAVNFIMKRHQNTQFLYTDADGAEKIGTITRDNVAYFLKTFMADDKVTGAPNEIPECFKSLYGKSAPSI